MIGDFFLSLLLIAIAIIVRIDTSGYPVFSRTVSVGPGMFPNIISYFLFFCAAFFLLKIAYKVFIKKTDANGVSYFESEKSAASAVFKSLKEKRSSLLGTLGVLVLMFMYATFLKTVGFEICTILFVLGVMLCCGEKRPLRLLLVPLISMFAVLLIFKILLNVALPLQIFTSL